MFEAFEPNTNGETFRFRKLESLVRRLGGDDWQLEHESQCWPPLETRTLMVLRRDRTQPSAWHVVTRLRVPAEALVT